MGKITDTQHFCIYKIFQSNNWKSPLPTDNAWGLKCKSCGKEIFIGHTKKELNRIKED